MTHLNYSLATCLVGRKHSDANGEVPVNCLFATWWRGRFRGDTFGDCLGEDAGSNRSQSGEKNEKAHDVEVVVIIVVIVVLYNIKVCGVWSVCLVVTRWCEKVNG